MYRIKCTQNLTGTCCDPSVNHGKKHHRKTAALDKKLGWRLCTRIVSSIGLNAEETSNNASIYMLTLFCEKNKSFATLERAVSVLWSGRYAD